VRGKYLSLTSAALLVLIWISLNVGASKVASPLKALFGSGSIGDIAIIQEIRAPRILAAILVGTTLGIAGALSQGALRNPLAEPALLGTSGGAAFATLLGILFFNVTIGSVAAIALGIIGAFIATQVTFQLGKSGRDGFSFIVLGIAVSAVLIALVGITTVMINKPEARGVTFWSLGTLSMSTKSQVLLLIPILLPIWVISIIFAEKLDYLALGDIRAKHLGENSKRIRFIAFTLIAIMVGAVTSIFGQISFLALAIPHIVRSIIGPMHKLLVIHGAVLGAFLLLLADLIARTLASPNELPIGLVTALLGAPVLIISVKSWVARHA